MDLMKEQRHLERFELKLPARVEVIASKKEMEKEILEDLWTGDISAGGAYFHTPRPLSEGTEVKIDLILPLERLKKLQGNRACIKINGRVTRALSEGMAIRFNKRFKIVPLDDA
ncbi:MAG: PilZ domain-containing protein [Pseudomonadota bacterium]